MEKLNRYVIRDCSDKQPITRWGEIFKNMLNNNMYFRYPETYKIFTLMWKALAWPHYFTKRRGLAHKTILTPRRACIKIEKWVVLYLYARGMNFVLIYDLVVRFRNCSDSVVFFIFRFITCFYAHINYIPVSTLWIPRRQINVLKHMSTLQCTLISPI